MKSERSSEKGKTQFRIRNWRIVFGEKEYVETVCLFNITSTLLLKFKDRSLIVSEKPNRIFGKRELFGAIIYLTIPVF